MSSPSHSWGFKGKNVAMTDRHSVVGDLFYKDFKQPTSICRGAG